MYDIVYRNYFHSCKRKKKIINKFHNSTWRKTLLFRVLTVYLRNYWYSRWKTSSFYRRRFHWSGWIFRNGMFERYPYPVFSRGFLSCCQDDCGYQNCVNNSIRWLQQKFVRDSVSSVYLSVEILNFNVFSETATSVTVSSSSSVKSSKLWPSSEKIEASSDFC